MVWSILEKHPLMSPSMNHLVPVQVSPTSFRAVWHPLYGLDQGIGHLASMSPQKNERLNPHKG